MSMQNAAYAAAQANGTVSSSSGRLDTIVVPGADHLTMTDGPWDNTTIVDGYTGALAWLITQQRPQPGERADSSPRRLTDTVAAFACQPKYLVWT